MDPATVIAILNALLAFVMDVPALVQGIQTAISLLQDGGGRDPTPAEKADIDALLDAAHAKLQGS